MTARPNDLRRLDRGRDGRPAAPVRIVHLGLGNFFRAHAAWYTEHAADAAEWGIAAFTGRSPAAAIALAEQNALYTLLVRWPDAVRAEVISSLASVHAATDLDALRGYFRTADLAIVTLTVTEAGYCRTPDGDLDLAAPDVQADLAALLEDRLTGTVTTTPGRLVAGLLARRGADVPGLAIVSNDNVPDNGEMVSRVVGQLAAAVDVGLADWMADHVSFVTTMVDRITPRTTDADRAEAAAQLDVEDPETVPTEPFSEWVLAGGFPGGRPAWEGSGARFVEDIRPFEQRKLLLLNGAHSLMAYAGSIRGHQDVCEAIADPVVREWVEQWWDAASEHVPLPTEDLATYRQALRDRFGNPNLRHLLAQIAADGSQKIPIRAVTVINAEAAAGQVSEGATRLVAAWVAHLRGSGAPVSDIRADDLVAIAGGSPDEAVAGVLAFLGVDDAGVARTVLRQLGELEQAARP